MGAGGYPHADDDDLRGAAEQASKHAGDSGDRDLFSSIISALGDKKQALASEDVDEQDAMEQHKRVYNDSGDHQMDSSSLGSAAALQALKMMIGGHNGGQSSGHGTQTDYVAIAMGEASKLFDKKAAQGQVPGHASKEATIQQAAETALKLYMKSGQSQGHGSSGGANLMSLASRFLQ